MTGPPPSRRADLVALTDRLLRDARTSADPQRRAELLAQVLEAHRDIIDVLADLYGGDASEETRLATHEAFALALADFDPAEGTDLLSFAVPIVVRRLRRRLRDSGWSLRPPAPRGVTCRVVADD